MFIEEPEAFKTWLTNILKPMCDADPAALAKYIIALVKKDKSTSALRESMVNQLEVFLQGETESFVNLLFKTLDTQEYLTPIIPNTNPPNPHVDLIEPSLRSSKDLNKPSEVIPASDLPSLSDGINNGTKKDREDAGSKRDFKKSDNADRDDKPLTSSTSSLTSGSLPANRRRSRHRSLSRERNRNTSRSRSRSWDRCRRQSSRSPLLQTNNTEQTPSSTNTSNKPLTSSHSHHHHSTLGRDKGNLDKPGGGNVDHRRGNNVSGGRSGTWRNKSPPNRRYGGGRGGDRRGASQSPGREGRDGARKSRSRSPVRHGGYRGSTRSSYRNRSPPPPSLSSSHHRSPAAQSRSRSRERLPPPSTTTNTTANTVQLTGPPGGTATPTQDSSHGDMDLRLSNTAQSIQSVVVAAAQAAAAAAAAAQVGGGGVAPPGTGMGPVLVGKRRCRDYDEKGYCMRGEMCPYDHGIDPVVVEDTTLSQVLAYTSSSAVPPQPNGQVVSLPALDGPPPPHHLHPHQLSRLPPPPQLGGGGPPPEYNPQAPQIWRGPPPQQQQMIGPGMIGQMGIGYGPPPLPPGSLPPPLGQPPPILAPLQQRELISIPTTIDPHHQQQHHKLPPIMTNNNNNNMNNNNPMLNQQQHHVDQSIGNHVYNQQQQHHHHHSGIGRHPYNNSGLFKRKTFDYNRLGPRRGGGMGGAGGGGGVLLNCALELKKVPVGMNNISLLNNHFFKFGKIVNIQVCYDGDPEAAILTFSSHAEANAAYRSTEAVLNNRFIKVFWHLSEGGNKGTTLSPPPPGSSPTIGSGAAATGPASSGTEKENNNLHQQQLADDKVVAMTKEELAAQQVQQKDVAVAAIKRGQELLAAKEKLKKNQEEKRREAVKLTQDLRKRKQELLEKQLAQQKLLIDKMEKTAAGVQRDKLLETIKKSQESIEAIRKDMLTQPATAPPKLVTPIQTVKSKEEVQKEMLDAELDLIAKQQEGQDTTDVQKKLRELQARERQLMVLRSGFHKGAKRYNPLQVNRTLLTKNNLVGEGNNLLKGNVKSVNAKSTTNNQIQQQVQQKHAVDHRPTRILVSGYENDEIDSVLTYFGQFGEISDHHSDPSTPHVILNYHSRKEAEQALLRGKHFQDRTLSVTWCLTPPPLSSATSGKPATVAASLPTTPLSAATVAQQPSTSTAAVATPSTVRDSGSGKKRRRLSGRTVLLSTGSEDSDVLLDDDDDDLLDAVEEGVLLDGLDEDRMLTEAGGGDGKTVQGVSKVVAATVEGGDDELGAEIAEEVLLQDDEEEDEENEDRSWRR